MMNYVCDNAKGDDNRRPRRFRKKYDRRMKIIAPRSNNLHTIEKRQDSHLLFSEFEEDALFFVDDTAFSLSLQPSSSPSTPKSSPSTQRTSSPSVYKSSSPSLRKSPSPTLHKSLSPSLQDTSNPSMSPSSNSKDFDIKIYSINLYAGDDLTKMILPQGSDHPCIDNPILNYDNDSIKKCIIGTTVNDILKSDFKRRSKIIANFIAEKSPDVIGLQEAIFIEVNVPQVDTMRQIK